MTSPDSGESIFLYLLSDDVVREIMDEIPELGPSIIEHRVLEDFTKNERTHENLKNFKHQIYNILTSEDYLDASELVQLISDSDPEDEIVQQFLTYLESRHQYAGTNYKAREPIYHALLSHMRSTQKVKKLEALDVRTEYKDLILENIYSDGQLNRVSGSITSAISEILEKFPEKKKHSHHVRTHIDYLFEKFMKYNNLTNFFKETTEGKKLLELIDGLPGFPLLYFRAIIEEKIDGNLHKYEHMQSIDEYPDIFSKFLKKII